jgi:hypothetical protein
VARTVSVATKNERDWITAYVRRRDAWLQSVSRLNKTRYRTKFFLSQIAISNWQMKLPMNVHGVRLTDEHFAELSTTEPVSRSMPAEITAEPQTATLSNSESTQASSSIYETAATTFDKVDGVVSGVVTRTDRAKSLWASVGGTLWQAVWGVVGFLAGVPREVWITVAIIAGVLTADVPLPADSFRKNEGTKMNDFKNITLAWTSTLGTLLATVDGYQLDVGDSAAGAVLRDRKNG